jgi:hypothetical protein
MTPSSPEPRQQLKDEFYAQITSVRAAAGFGADNGDQHGRDALPCSAARSRDIGWRCLLSTRSDLGT